MPPGRPKGIGAPLLGLTALWATLVVAGPSAASADPDPGAESGPVDAVRPAERGAPGTPNRGWISVALITGTTQFGAELADYQWDTAPQAGWGVRALAGRGRLACGLRAWRASTTQSIGDLGDPPAVHATSWELIGEGRLIELWGTRVHATGSAGRLHLGYSPDRITIQPPGAASPIVVDLEPVGAWIVGGGLMVRRTVAPSWTVGLGADARRFSIDASHRAGDQVVQTRETLGDWSARFELAWQVVWP